MTATQDSTCVAALAAAMVEAEGARNAIAQAQQRVAELAAQFERAQGGCLALGRLLGLDDGEAIDAAVSNNDFGLADALKEARGR